MTDNLAEKLLKYPTAIGRFCFVIINNIYCIPTYVVWMGLLLPLKRLHPDAYYKIEGLLFHWLLAVVSMWSYTAGYNIVEVGDDIEECRNKKTLVIANHQSTADVPLLMANFNAKEGILPNIMWIMDRLFKYTNFGIVSIIHQDFFIASGKNKRDESIESLKLHIKDSFLKRNRKWMVLFPEGGFLRKRREVSQRFAKKNNLPFLQHVTLPRVGALKAIMDVMVQAASAHMHSLSIENVMNKNLLFNDNKSSSAAPSSVASAELKPNYNLYEDSVGSLLTNRSTNAAAKQSPDSSIQMQSTASETEALVNDKNALSENAASNSRLAPSSSMENRAAEAAAAASATQAKSNTLPNGNTKSLKQNLLNFVSQSSASEQSAQQTSEAAAAAVTASDPNCPSNNNKNSANCLLEYILDITIAYPKSIPLDLPNIVHGMRRPCETYLLYRLYKVSNIPKDSEALTKWLYDRFVEKDQLLERFYKTGQFYLDRTMNNGQVIQQDVLRFMLINLFFITSTYFHYQMFTSLYTYGLHLTYGES